VRLCTSRVIAKFRADESGVLHTTDYRLLVSVCAVGMLVGLTEIRNSTVQVMADMAGALEALDQSYSFAVSGTTSEYNDTPSGSDSAGDEPQGISVQDVATQEN